MILDEIAIVSSRIPDHGRPSTPVDTKLHLSVTIENAFFNGGVLHVLLVLRVVRYTIDYRLYTV